VCYLCAICVLAAVDPKLAELRDVLGGGTSDATLTALLARYGSVALAADGFFESGVLGLRLSTGDDAPTGDAALVAEAIGARLARGEGLSGGHLRTDSFGKLLERILTLRRLGAPFWRQLTPIAESLLDELKSRRVALVRAAEGPPSLQTLAAEALAHTEGAAAAAAIVPEVVAASLPADTSLRVAVLGDASGSMQACVEAACIAGAMVTAIFDAELLFYNEGAFRASSHPCPRSAAEVLEVSEEVRAVGGTAPAAALLEFYSARKPVDLLIVVTDEEESDVPTGMPEGAHGFAELFARYRREVHAEAKLVFVSFLDNVAEEGKMVRALRALSELPAGAVSQVKYDIRRPDLSKFDDLLSAVMREAQRTIDARNKPASAA